jgi:hypothetical protein
MSSSSLAKDRCQASLSINSDVPRLKSHLMDYLTQVEVGAVITQTKLNETLVHFEGPRSLVEKSPKVLPEHLSFYFRGLGVVVVASDLEISSERLDGVKIVETNPALKRSDPSGDLKEVPLDDEIPLG